MHYTHLQVCDNYIACDIHFPSSVAIKSSGCERVKILETNPLLKISRINEVLLACVKNFLYIMSYRACFLFGSYKISVVSKVGLNLAYM